MYTALLIMIAGIVIGKIFNNHLSTKLLHYFTVITIFILLFLLGLEIGANENLFIHLSDLGLQALIIMIFCVAGSITAVVLLKYLLKHYHKSI